MKNINIIRNLFLSAFVVLAFSASTFAAPVIRKAAKFSGAELVSTFFQFSSDITGGEGLNQPGIQGISWEEMPDNADSNIFPGDYYNTTVPRGVVLSSACTVDGFRVSNASSSSQPLYFGEVNANYAADFKAFSSARLFSGNQGACNFIDVYFFVPGTKIPATVNGFGAVFADVDTNQSTGIIYYGIDGKELIPAQNATLFNNGMSFLGVSFNNGERIAHVRIFSGTGVLGDVDKSRGGQLDVVVMDDFIYSEPRAIGHHESDFDGDGTADLAVFRPLDGNWYVLSSASNTYSVIRWGQAGDIPVDGDFDGDSRNDLAVFRPSNGTWYILQSLNGQIKYSVFGLAGDKPVVGDYDKDGISDIALWRPSDGNYYSLNSSNGQAKTTHFGLNGDIPIGSN